MAARTTARTRLLRLRPQRRHRLASTAAASTAAAAGGKVGVILPDSKSSVRWESFDRRYLGDAFKAAGVEYDIQNAEGDKNKMATIADQMITSGVKVLMIVNLDSESGAAIEKKAADAGVQTIDYDRLTLGGSAAAYVSFDNVKVGTLQGEGLVKCLTDKGVDEAGRRRAERLADRQQRHAVQRAATTPSSSRSSTPATGRWSTTRACRTGTTRRAARSSSRCSRRPAARSTACSPPTTASATRPSPCSRRTTCRCPVTGQDATPEGLQNILAGDQCMTVYKAVKTEADGCRRRRASRCSSGQEPATTGTVRRRHRATVTCRPCSPTRSPSTRTTSSVVTDDGFVTVADICTPDLAAACTEAGLQ